MFLLFKNNFKDITRGIWNFLSILFLVIIGFSVFNGIIEYNTQLSSEVYNSYNIGKLRDSFIDDEKFKKFANTDIEGSFEKVKNNLQEISKEIDPKFAFYWDNHQVFNYLITNQNNFNFFKFIQYNYIKVKDDNYYSNKIIHLQGRLPKNNNEVLITPKYLKFNHLKIGQTIYLESIGHFKIVGTCNLPQYLYFDFTIKRFPSYDSQTYFIFNNLNKDTEQNLKQINTETYQFQIKYKKTLSSAEKIQGTKIINDKLNKALSSKSLLTFYDSFSTFDIFNYSIINRLEAVDLFAYSIVIIIFLLTEFLIVLVLKRKIQANRYQLGVFKANGITTSQLIIVNLAMPICLLLIGGLLAIPIAFGIYTAIRVASITIFAFYMQFSPFAINWLVVLYSFFVVSAIVLFFSVIVLYLNLKDKPLDLIKLEDKPISSWMYQWTTIFKKAPFIVRLRFSLFLNSIRKIIFIFIATVSTTFLVALGILGMLFSPLITNGLNNALKYQYLYQLSGNWRDETAHPSSYSRPLSFSNSLNFPPPLFYNPNPSSVGKYLYKDGNESWFKNKGTQKNPPQFNTWIKQVYKDFFKQYQSNNHYIVVSQQSFPYINFLINGNDIILKEKPHQPPSKDPTSWTISNNGPHKINDLLWKQLIRFASPHSTFSFNFNLYPYDLNNEMYYFSTNLFQSRYGYNLTFFINKWQPKEVSKFLGFIPSYDLDKTNITVNKQAKEIDLNAFINLKASKYFQGIKAGDTISFSITSPKDYKVKIHVIDILSDYNVNPNIFVYVSQSQLNQLIYDPNPVFSPFSTTLLSNNPTIDSNLFVSVLAPNTLNLNKVTSVYNFIINKKIIFKIVQSNLQLMIIFFVVFAVVSLLISFFVMFVSFNLIIFENRKVIGGMKLFGYKSGELSLTFLLIYIVFIILGVIIGLITNYFVLTFIMQMVALKLKLSFIFPYPWYIFVVSFILIFLLIILSYFLSKKQIEKISYRQIF